MTAVPVMAETRDDVSKPNPVAAKSPHYVKQVREGSEMLGQIDLVRSSLDLGFTDDALDHIQQAQKLAAELKKQSPDLFVASTLKVGDKIYTFNEEFKHYLVPVVDNRFTYTDYNMKVKIDPSKDQISEKDASVERYMLSLDLRNVEAALERAKTFTEEDKLIDATLALNSVFDGAFENFVNYTDPIWAVHDNLIASQAMVIDENYDGARFALKTAEKELKAVEKSNIYPEDSNTLAVMKGEVIALQTMLRDRDPTILQKTEKSISKWLKNIRNIIYKNNNK